MEQRRLNRWLLSEQVAAAAEKALVVELSSKEKARLQGECTECTRKKLLVGLLKPVGAELVMDVHNPGRAAKAKQPGALQSTADGGVVWTAVVRSPGATAMRLHLTGVSLPKGAELYVYNHHGEAYGPYTGTGKRDDGEVWTNTVSGEEIMLQLRHWNAAATPKRWRNASLVIAEIDHLGPRFVLPLHLGLPGFNEGEKAFCSYNASCVEDAECYDSSDFTHIENLRRAVAHYQFSDGGSTYICSGGLLNDTDTATTIPYFLTANHCLSTASVAASMELYWQYWTASCGGSCYNPIGAVPHTSGATIVHEDDTTDHTLLELDDAPPAGSVYMGWSASAVANSSGTNLFRIHHPSGAPQAFARHSVDTSAGTCTGLARGNFIYSDDEVGATEGGSSGSIVVNGSGQVVGQLLGCCGTNCDNVCDGTANSTVDGALASYFSDVEEWLDPDTGGDALLNGVPKTNLSANKNQERDYYMVVPSDAVNLSFVTAGSNGDADLYVKFGSAPTTSSFDCRSWSGSSNETCSFASPSTGTYYVMVRAYEAFSGLSLTGSYDIDGGDPPVANFSFTTSGLTAYFSDSSSDPDGSVVSRSWNFGDGYTSSSTNPSHTYGSADTYTVTLTVTDNDDMTDSIQKSVTVNDGAPCTDCDHYAGTLSGDGDADVQPNGSYYRTYTSGTQRGWLEGPSGTDFDLYLYKWTGSWTRVATSESGDSEESIAYSGSAGYYYWRVYSYDGSGSYDLWLQTP